MSAIIQQQYEETYTLFKDNKHHQIKKLHNIEINSDKPKLGVMLVGMGGNNGTTFVSGIQANKHNISWETKNGKQEPNYYGSQSQSATAKVGIEMNEDNTIHDIHMPIKEIVPLINPNDIEITGWDISDLNMYEATRRAKVIDYNLQQNLKDYLGNITPMKAFYNPEQIASNQLDRATNLIEGTNREIIAQIKSDIQNFKKKVDKIVVLWTANTEKNGPEINNVNKLEQLIDENYSLPASVLYAYATLDEECIQLNGSPQNTIQQGMIDFAEINNTQIAGSDFKSGQTRFKTIMSDYLAGAGLRLSSVVSQNHLGNNDGKNLSENKCLNSKIISKSSVLDDMINSNKILYPENNKEIDHCVVIKYVPFVGDSKRAIDEQTSNIFLDGLNTIVTQNMCEDSLLATPIMIDLVLIAEFLSRVKVDNKQLGPVLSQLSFFFKAPTTNHKEQVINSFVRQREMLTNFLKACGGYGNEDNVLLDGKF